MLSRQIVSRYSILRAPAAALQFCSEGYNYSLLLFLRMCTVCDKDLISS